MTTATETTHPAWTWRWRQWSRGDRRAFWSFLAVPTILFVVPALFNHPAIDADNLIQNFPLRVLVGRQLDSGHLPLLNPYGNAGTPLLGGMNAGAFFPLTLLFAFVPAIGAWILNLIAVYFACALGAFALGRWHGLSTRASVFAAFSYAYSGAMIGQVVHLGVVQGFALLPWVILLLVSFARRLRGELPVAKRELFRALSPWLLSATGLWALVFLTGEPRAIAEVELVSLVVLAAVFFARSSYRLMTWRSRGWYAGTLAVSFLWGVAVAAIQILPAWSFIRFSERSVVTYSFFGAGSLAPRWSILFGLPDALGGNGALATSPFFAHYNLPEVTSYAGVLALCALFAFLAQRRLRGWGEGERDYALFAAIALVGLFAAWGNYTVVGHLFRALPLFGSTRLQSRNAVLVDLGLSMLLGWWIDRLERRDDRRARIAALAPALVIAILALIVIGWGPWFVGELGISKATSALATGLKPAMFVHLMIALGVIALLTLGARFKHLVRLLAVVLALDLLTFSMLNATGLVGGPGPTEPSHASVASVLSTQGRFALVDPSSQHTKLFRQLGEPNMNVFTRLASAQGYGALVSNFYDANTGSHPQGGLSACHLAQGTFTQLRLNSLVVASSLLKSRSPNRAARGCAPVPRLKHTARYFGQELQVARIALRGTANASVPVVASLRLLNAAGVAFGKAYDVTASAPMTLRLASPQWAGGFEVTTARRTQLREALVTTSTGAHYYLDSGFEVALSSPKWRLTSTMLDVQVFKTTQLQLRAWLQSPRRGGVVTSITTSAWGDTWMKVSATHATVLERSEAYLPGWRATATNVATGAVVELPVTRAGLIQRVTVPPGTWNLHFHYHAPYIEAGLFASLAAGGAFVVALGWAWRRRRLDKVTS
ncbi:MAG TPA: hypothetical protein VMU98_08330 [Acidimicrobiales bacterium]|nr:hypothetical protein [Acidimicrobiales bacterium]